MTIYKQNMLLFTHNGVKFSTLFDEPFFKTILKLDSINLESFINFRLLNLLTKTKLGLSLKHLRKEKLRVYTFS